MGVDACRGNDEKTVDFGFSCRFYHSAGNCKVVMKHGALMSPIIFNAAYARCQIHADVLVFAGVESVTFVRAVTFDKSDTVFEVGDIFDFAV